MNLAIAITYLILGGLIAFLILLLLHRMRKEGIEINSAILGPADLEKHAVELARSHTVYKDDRTPYRLVPRLNDNFALVTSVYKMLSTDVENMYNTAPAAEWLLDNYYVIEEQVKDIRHCLTKCSFSKLPVLNSGYLKGYPRVYAIALELISHTDARLDEESITSFLRTYQSEITLSMSELWAFAIMLRLALIEGLRHLCEKVMESQNQWHEADKTAAALIEESNTGRPDLIMEKLGCIDRFKPSFVEHLLQDLRKGRNRASDIIRLIEVRLVEQNTSIEIITSLEHQLQASRQVSMGNSVTGLRLVATMNWSDMFEALSKVEQILSEDPCGIYKGMDFESRDYYRHRIEKLARLHGTTETNIARQAVNCAREASESGMAGAAASHAGYYIVDKGTVVLEKKLGHRKYKGSGFAGFIKRHPSPVYMGSVCCLSIAFASIFCILANAAAGGIRPLIAGLFFVIVLIPASDISVSIVNSLVSHICKPTVFPRLELADGIPEGLSTMVIIPTLLPNEKRVRQLLEQLELYYLSNREENLYFALVGDFKDAPSQNQPEDRAIIQTALEGIAELNKRYGENGRKVFYYFHRQRQYNSYQNKWMGWERKRGAIIEFNECIRGSGSTGYTITGSSSGELPPVKYIITLDADTNLPMNAARRLIGTLAHVLNSPVVDSRTGRVVRGYGILQPRIGISIDAANKSPFSRIFAGQGGIDPYTTAVSDVYQDLFGEGIFTGKGIYDLEVFQGILRDAIPENAVLSHDLLEGCYIRAGLVTDIELIDGYPSRFNSYAMRLHRWVRGDWQLLPWLCSRVRDRFGRKVKNPLSTVCKWKIIDNLRRSLVNPALLVLSLAGALILPQAWLVWTLSVLVTVFLPLWSCFFNDLISGKYISNNSKGSDSSIEGIKAPFYQSLLLLAFIPYQAWLMADAVIKTLVRVCITRRNMLEWITAADMELQLKNNPASFWKRMWISPAAGLLLSGISLLQGVGVFLASLPFAIGWLISPWLAFVISRQFEKKRIPLAPSDMLELRLLARKTWRYYEDFATEEDNYLPPDNFQEDPPRGVAHRTSPTNIGFLLISMLTARDMGYIGTSRLAALIERTLGTIESMDKWKGHLYNWYDTVTLRVLRPLYVSTVDSGNYIGYLMVLEQGLEEYLHKPLLTCDLAKGLMDTVSLYNEEAGEQSGRISLDILKALESRENLAPEEWRSALVRLRNELSGKVNQENSFWGKKLLENLDMYLQELEELFLPSDFFDLNYRGHDRQEPDIGELVRLCTGSCSLSGLIEGYERLQAALEKEIRHCRRSRKIEDPDKNCAGLMALLEAVQKLLGNCRTLADSYMSLKERVKVQIEAMEFSPLFDKRRQLFAIGYNVEEGHLGKSYYDLLASEARQASYIAVARGEIDPRHWFRLGRRLVMIDGFKGLVSWTGTMFEYLMPTLIMKSFDNTILDETYRFVVRNQIKYGKKRNVPWGVSESGFNAFDLNLNYQYKAFGIPELGLKRGLGNDIVIAPYATVLGLACDPAAALDNLRTLKASGFEGAYGLYEAIDYTPARLGRGERYRVIKSFMAHHQGMSLIALNNHFNDNIMQDRFHGNPLIKAAELLLQERVPSRVTFNKEHRDDFTYLKQVEQNDGEVIRTLGLPGESLPEVHILSNGSYSVMLTNGGSGYSRLNSIDITRWRGGFKEPSGGMYIYVRNINSNDSWSASYMPAGNEPELYRVVFSPDKAEYLRKDGSIETHTEVVVSPEDSVEIRRVSLTNRSQKTRVMEVTSYFEVVLTGHAADAAHPAFSNLFIRTELAAQYDSLIASRRPRSSGQAPVYAVHTAAVEGEVIGDIQYETDRFKFIGRDRSLTDPLAMDVNQPLSGTVGSVLDPVMSLRRRVRLAPGQTARISFAAGMADTREKALELAEKYHDPRSTERAMELSWTRSQVESRYLGFKAEEVRLYIKIMPHLLYNSPARRKWAGTIKKNTKGQPGLWPFGISGDIPILLISIASKDEAELVQRMLKAHEYWRMKGLTVDLVILLEDESSYTQPLFDAVRDMVAASHARELQDRPGGVFIRNAGVMSEEDRVLLYTSARLVLKGDTGPAEEQLDSNEAATLPSVIKCAGGEFEPDGPVMAQPAKSGPSEELKFFNGLGGFDSDGREYVIHLKEGHSTPAPWINVIANRSFGFLVSESGAGYTWAENSRENKLTPWSNDPVTNPPGEVFYLRDDDSGRVWSITPAPIRQKVDYTIRHGFGYTVFSQSGNRLEQQLTMFAAQDAQVKLCIIKLRNLEKRKRCVSVTYFIQPVMGVVEQGTEPYIVTDINSATGSLFIRNVFNSDFPGRIMFMDCSEKERSFTGDRAEFIGLNGSLREPAGLRREKLSGRVGAGLEPCGAIQAQIELDGQEERELLFILGHASDRKEAADLAGRFRKLPAARAELDKVRSFWSEKLGKVRVSTPDTSMDYLLNGWLLYQVIACRIWARSAFYQSGGAYGFRDQLQDSLAVTYIWPENTKRQLLLHAAHQFLEGDVQHWWHSGADKGIRTRYSDDLVWLVYVTEDYIKCTGDWSILDEEAGWLESDPLPEDEDERYDIPRVASRTSPLYDHCTSALDRALRFGPHGIPLMGSGDWNDGMNTVGNKGRGESVWLGWFLYRVLVDFIPVCSARGDHERAERYRHIADSIAEAVEAGAWDGSWYRRAYFDDGTPLGSAQNTECRIDSLAQSWSVISGAGRESRTREAMNAVENYLVDRGEGLIKLLTPPFNEGNLEPGYIKSYVPGVRENGGQYTHASVWVIMAFAKLGWGDKAWELYHLINPVNHARTPIEYMRYKVEPYVMAADVYAVNPHAGRGGWSWYTGAAGWMYRVGMENILGLTREGTHVTINPCIPRNWDAYTIFFSEGRSVYEIRVINPDGVSTGVRKVVLDGDELADVKFELKDDGRKHQVEVLMGGQG